MAISWVLPEIGSRVIQLCLISRLADSSPTISCLGFECQQEELVGQGVM